MATRQRVAPRPEGDEPSAVATAQAVFGDDIVKGIHGKLNAILRGMPNDMRPEGNNTHFHYKYWELDQISGYFRNRFAELGLSFMADVVDFVITEHKTAKGGSSLLTTMRVLFTITDSDTGETISGHGIGQGDDPGDKGANKAFSGALKYWLLKVFIVGGDDPEADTQTDRRYEDRGRSRGGDSDDPVVIDDSNIEGIARGGRSAHTTNVQVTQIKHLAKDLGWNAAGTARRITEWLGDDLELPEREEEIPDVLRSYLDKLSGDDAGTVITKMIELRDTPDEEVDEDDRSEPGYG